MKTLKDYLIEGGREDLIPLMDEWDRHVRTEYPKEMDEVFKQHPELSAQEGHARAGYRWLTMKYPKRSKVEDRNSKLEERVPSDEFRVTNFGLPRWAIIAWGVVVVLLLAAILARSEPKRHFAFTVPNGLLFAIDRVGPSVAVQDEGTQIGYWAAGVATLNFTGGGITCTFASGKVTCNVPTGGGGASWDALTNPAANQSLSMGAFTSTWTFGAATGAGVNLINITDTLNNTGTGILFRVFTASGSAATPFQADANGNGWLVDTAGLFKRLGTGTLAIPGTSNGVVISRGATAGVATTGAGVAGQLLQSNGPGVDPSFTDPIVSGPAAEGAAPANNPVWVAGRDGTPFIRSLFLMNSNPAGTEYGLVVRNIPSGTQTITGTATSNQGTAAAHANRWPVGLSDGTSFIFPATDRTTAAGPFAARISDGTNFIDPREAVPTAVAANAASIFYNQAVTTTQTVKASAGNLYGWYIYNPNSSACYLQIFNTTTPTLGTTVPIASLGVPATSGANIPPGAGVAIANFSTAIAVAATTTAQGATTCTTGMTANIWFK